ncbi:hypothetical protein P7C70_g5995, partial [Phenoliferia sp. Uapishka_3]
MQNPTNLNSLPPELIIEILSLTLQSTPQIRLRYSLLKSFSLVSPSFQHAAQRLLFEDVYIYHETVAQAFLTSQRELDYSIQTLRMFGDLNWDGVESLGTAGEVVRSARGVGSLALWYFEGIEGGVLEGVHLADLSSLLLSTEILPSTEDELPLNLSFRLTNLRLSNYCYPSSLISSLFSTSSNSLTTLDLSSYGGSQGTIDSSIIDNFHLIAPTLLILHLPPITNPNFTSQLALCTSLQRLHLLETDEENLSSTFQALSSTRLISLSTRLPGSEGSERLRFLCDLVRLGDKFSALKELGRLTVLRSAGVLEEDGAEIVLRSCMNKCAEKGVRLVLEK